MKHFKDLVFKPHRMSYLPELKGTKAASIKFDDGSFISVICSPITGRDSGFYCGTDSFECMSNRFRGKGDVVRGYMSDKSITKAMVYIQKNPLKNKS